MTRPDVEGILRDNGDVQTVAKLCRYILALEAAWEVIRTMDPNLEATYNGAVARWAP